MADEPGTELELASNVIALRAAFDRQLAEVSSASDAKELHNRLSALAEYARRVKLDHDKQNQIAEMKLRTARKGGQLLAETVKANRPKELSATSTVLPDGLSRNDSSKWQRLASGYATDADLERYVRETLMGGGELTMAGALRHLDERHLIEDVNAASVDPDAHWVGLPEFIPAGEPLKLVISFGSPDDRDEALRRLGITTIHKNTRGVLSTWYPQREQEDLSSLRFVDEDRG